MKNITNIFKILFFSLFSIASIMGQNPAFVYLPDMTGYSLEDSPQNLKDDLMEAAESLRVALPDTAMQNDFAVYDMGFYTHHAVMTGGVQKVMADAISDRITHSYYLLFGREMDREGRIKKVWVEVELPEEEWLLDCFNQTYIDVVKARIRNKTDEAFNQNTPQITAGIQTISYFADEIKKLADCCDPLSSFRQQECQECESIEEIYEWFMDHGFVGLEVEGITFDVPIQNYNNIDDHAGVYWNGVALAQIAHEIIGNIAALNATTSTVFITGNSDFCTGLVDFVVNQYTANLNNFDVWMHLWNDTLNNMQILFIRTEFYVLLDDPSFMQYYDGVGPVTLMDPVSRSQQSDSIHFFIVDPETNRFYLTNKVMPLPRGIIELSPLAIPAHPKHLVKSGETLNSIVQEWGNAFEVDDLIRWNPNKLENEFTLLQVGWNLLLYNEEYEDLLKNEFDIWGYTVPDIHLELMNLVAPSAHPQLGGALPLMRPESSRTTLRIIKNTNYNNIQEIIKKQSLWDKIHAPFKGGKILITVIRGTNIIGLMLGTQSGGQPFSPPMSEVQFRFKEKLEEEDEEDKLTYVTYTKYNPNVSNAGGLTNGKVYVGRTSGYNKHPIKLIKKRDLGLKHHKSPEYGTACYDHHEYSKTNKRNNRWSDSAYKTIRGREQKIIESMGGAWSDNKGPQGVKNTRSGNAINGIAKSRIGFYNACLQLAEKANINGNPLHPQIDWQPVCYDEWWRDYSTYLFFD